MRLNYEINVGTSFRNIRIKNKMSQEKVTELAHIDPKHYGRIERNLCYPKLDTFIDICKALKISPIDFFKNNLISI